jgi:GTPase SAR1 family protein
MDEFVVMRTAWIKDREAFLLVYAINDRESFLALHTFYEQLVLIHGQSLSGLSGNMAESHSLSGGMKINLGLGSTSSMNHSQSHEERHMGLKNIPLIIVGNKSDLENERAVSFEEGDRLAKQFQAQYMETSAKTDYNINKVFEILGRKLLNIKYPTKDPKNKNIKKKGCCDSCIIF